MKYLVALGILVSISLFANPQLYSKQADYAREAVRQFKANGQAVCKITVTDTSYEVVAKMPGVPCSPSDY